MGYMIFNGCKVFVYDELGLLKCFIYFIYFCILLDVDFVDIDKLDLFCKDYGFGFEVWFNFFCFYIVINFDEFFEYYDGSIFFKDILGVLVVIVFRWEVIVV